MYETLQDWLFRASAARRGDDNTNKATSMPLQTNCPDKLANGTPSRKTSAHDASGKESQRSVPPRKGIAIFVRLVFLDMPYLVVLLAAVGLGLLKHYQESFYDPMLETLEWTDERAEQEMTYYGRICTTDESTASSPEELLLSPDMTPEEVVDAMLTNGVAIFPDLIKPETAKILRETIVEHNHIEENFGVIENKNRWSYGIRMEQHPMVRKALREVATNPLLLSSLKPLIGDNPALYKLHAITSGYGAGDQYFHWDVKSESSSQQFSRSFAPLYSLFIPLQDTPAEMGATQMCPGSHVCADGVTFCHDTAFQVVFDSNSTDYPDQLVWPTGYGALMNQQTTHRGRAHLLEGGPDRVLFTLAITPRPRSNHISQLETRSLSLGGSYAIHWSQWAHTWNDLFQDTMYNPIKTIRSWGLLKPWNTQWGRELPFTVLLQIANGDYLDEDDLEYIFGAGEIGLWKLVPRYLHGAYPLPETYQDGDPGKLWYLWIVETIENCAKELQRWAVIGLTVYNIVVVSTNVLCCSMGMITPQMLLRNLQNWLKRLVVIHGIIALGGFLVFQKMHNTPWARHIQTGRAFTLPSEHRGPFLPSTLPTKEDILMLDDFQSDYLASYTRMYDVAHPGNAAWGKLVNMYAGHYSELLAPLQAKLCVDMVEWMGQDHGRFLVKNHVNQWARLPEGMAAEFVHKKLIRASNRFINEALQQISFLRSETKFGTWRETAMHRRYIPELLRTLENKIAQVRMDTRILPRSIPQPSSQPLLGGSRLAHAKTWPKQKGILPPRKGLPEPAEASEPYWGAWIQSGDIVDSMRFAEDDYRWYRGEITDAVGHVMKWEVRLSGTGEVVYPCKDCVKPYTAIEVGLEYDIQGTRGQVVSVNKQKQTFDYSKVGTRFISRNVPLWHISRMAPYDDITQYHPDLGEHVLAEYDDDAWSLAVVVSRQEGISVEPSYTIAYYDGDEAFAVLPQNIRPLHFSASR